MAFFKPTPNLSDGEKARIEFYLQQIAECIGFERFKLPVLSEDKLLNGEGANPTEFQTVDQIKNMVGKHLRHDVSELKLQTFPMQPQKVGGGG
jgi:hypothetical protein